MTTATATEPVVDRAYLEDMIHWIKTLTSAGVSPDAAAEVAKDFILPTCAGGHEEEVEEYYEEEI